MSFRFTGRKLFLRKNINISLVLLLGLYYNSVPIALLSYSTFAEKIFASHCINPGKPSCHGMCQVMRMQNKTTKSNQSQATSLQLPQLQPPLLFSVSIPKITSVAKRIVYSSDTPSLRSGSLQVPFHPPRILA